MMYETEATLALLELERDMRLIREGKVYVTTAGGDRLKLKNISDDLLEEMISKRKSNG